MLEQLKTYPNTIANIEKKLLKLNQEIEVQAQLLSFLDCENEKLIRENKELKNEQQRKSKRLELKQQPDYLEVVSNLKEAKEQRDLMTIKLNQGRNEFSVLKLELRMEIAVSEATA